MTLSRRLSNHSLPSVSVVVPTYNSSATLRQCLGSLREQAYPPGMLEIIIVDGGSRDDTLKIAASYGVDKILSNPLVTGEAGKAVGVASARNEVVALIDSDNILPSPNWLMSMVRPFADPSIVGVEPLYYTWRRRDPMITRYCALTGMNDILCLYLGNYDRYCHLTGRWTDLKLDGTDRGDFLTVDLDEKSIPTIGANGFMVRANPLRRLGLRPFLFDVDMVHRLIVSGNARFAKVRLGIVHVFARSARAYVNKTQRRISHYMYYDRLGARSYPWRGLYRKGIPRFVVTTVFTPLLLRDIAKGYRRMPDRAWFFHPLACWITLTVYGFSFLRGFRREKNSISQDVVPESPTRLRQLRIESWPPSDEAGGSSFQHSSSNLDAHTPQRHLDSHLQFNGQLSPDTQGNLAFENRNSS